MNPLSLFTPARLFIPKNTSDEWFVYYRYVDPSTGKRKMFKKSLGINRLKSSAEKKRFGSQVVNELNKLLREGWSPFGEKKYEKPLTESLEEMLKICEKSLRRRTWQSYKYSIDIFMQWIKNANLAYIYPSQFTQYHAQTFIDHVRLTKKFKGKTFNGCKNNIGTLMNMLVERELMDKNHFARIKNMPQEIGKNIAFTKSQQNTINKYLSEHDERLYLFTRFIYFTYIRPVELLRLKVSNVDLSKNIIIVYGSQSKNKKTESVVIPSAFIPYVEKMTLDKFSPNDYLFGKDLQTSSVSYSRNTVSLRHSKVLKHLKMPEELTMYSWKHTGVVEAYKSGIDIYSIMRQLRHHSLTQTQIYMKSLGLMPNTEFAEKMK